METACKPWIIASLSSIDAQGSAAFATAVNNSKAASVTQGSISRLRVELPQCHMLERSRIEENDLQAYPDEPHTCELRVFCVRSSTFVLLNKA